MQITWKEATHVHSYLKLERQNSHEYIFTGTHCTMQQGLTFEKKAITKCSTLKIDFSANFHLTHDFFLVGGSLNTPKIGKRKKEFTNINLRGCKTQKT